jgi:hypothetical protein
MDGTTAQLLSLVSYGNEYIINGNLEADYYPKNSVFQYFKNVDFYKLKKIIVGNDPIEWFQYLKKDECKKLKVFYQHSKQEKLKDYMAAGFVGGGGQWLIESVYSDYSDFWSGQWRVENRSDPDSKIWLVSYEAISRRNEVDEPQFILSKSLTLENKIKEIEAFARENNLNSWVDWFATALNTFESNKPYEDFYHPDMVVLKNYPLQTQQMIFGACKAWVFGGMGSWNDIGGFNDKEKNDRYYKLTEELYDEVIFALVNGINR